MIYLQPEVKSGLGEDTFWCWFDREFPETTFDDPPPFLRADDILLQYSTLGYPQTYGGIQVALLWELYPEMQYQLKSKQWRGVIDRTRLAAQSCDHRVVSTHLAKEFYEDCGKLDVLPIGVNTDMFAPMDKAACRAETVPGLPDDAKVGFWSGTRHEMKGFDRLLDYARDVPDVHWVIVFKHEADEKGPLPVNHTVYAKIDQLKLARAMNAADFLLVPGRLRPFFICEWEAMACNLPVVDLSGLEKDFDPGDNPRDTVLRHGWSRHDAKKKWASYLAKLIGARDAPTLVE
jgi:glycosyltransferase involved in cell wall biosynthesis